MLQTKIEIIYFYEEKKIVSTAVIENEKATNNRNQKGKLHVFSYVMTFNGRTMMFC
jgi:hypothetical protein